MNSVGRKDIRSSVERELAECTFKPKVIAKNKYYRKVKSKVKKITRNSKI